MAPEKVGSEQEVYVGQGSVPMRRSLKRWT